MFTTLSYIGLMRVQTKVPIHQVIARLDGILPEKT
jgi:hypothetical protein